MSTFLVIDSSTNVCTVALCIGNHYQELVGEEVKSHGASVLALVEELLKSNSVAMNSIDAFSVVAGPGSFTGLRIGISVAQGLAFALSRPVILLSSLELLALNSISNAAAEGVLVLLKSKENEIYFGCYKVFSGGLVRILGSEQVCKPEELALPKEALGLSSWLAVGDGWEYADIAKQRLQVEPMILSENAKLDSRALGRLTQQKFDQGEVVNAEHAFPNYVKEKLDYAKSR